MSASLPIMLTSLLWITPDLRQSLLHAIRNIRPQSQVAVTIHNRVAPIIDTVQT
jgi:hypothetical protein